MIATSELHASVPPSHTSLRRFLATSYTLADLKAHGAAAAARPDRPSRGHAVLARPPTPPGRYVEHVVGRRVRAQHGAAHHSSLSRSTTFLHDQHRFYDDATATDGPSDSEGDPSVSRVCVQHDMIAMGIGYMQWPS